MELSRARGGFQELALKSQELEGGLPRALGISQEVSLNSQEFAWTFQELSGIFQSFRGTLKIPCGLLRSSRTFSLNSLEPVRTSQEPPGTPRSIR